jgi:hypothetical protein
MASRVMLYQEMIDRYSDSHPFLLVRLADLFVLLKSGSLAIDLYRKVRYLRLRLSTRLTVTQTRPKVSYLL